MEDQEMFKVKLIFNEEQIEIPLNSQYEYFINSICNILKISSEQFLNLVLSYVDNDEDDVILSNQEDYNIFFQQVSQKQVDNFKITLKENCDLDQNECLINLLSYKEQQEQEQELPRNNIDNNINSDEEKEINENENRNNNYESNNSNENIINNNTDDKNKDVPIDDLIFDYKCTVCERFPIICKLFYCDKCNYYLCQDCEKNDVKHEHPLLKIESREDLKKIKEKENDEIDKKNKEKEKQMQRNFQTQLQQQKRNNNNYNYNYDSYYDRNYPQGNTGSHLVHRFDGNRRHYYINSNQNMNSHLNYNYNNPNQSFYPYYDSYGNYYDYQYYY